MNYTINEIPDEAVELSGNEMIPIWQGETKKVSVATLAGYVQDASSYSTTETLTGGKWIDGKPIYRKVVDGPDYLVANTWSNISSDTVISTIDRLITVVGVGGINVIPDATYRITGNILQGFCGGITTGTDTKYILEYTKTTD